jgi:hemin uptake protein HemP
MRIIPINGMRSAHLSNPATRHFQGVPMAEPPSVTRPQPSGRRDSGAPERVTSRELLGRCAELIIVHDGREYRLRVTQNGKLILTA